MSLAKQEFTDAGRSMLGRAQNTEILHISKIVVGSGSATAASELWPLTALKTYVMDVTISAKRDYGQGTLLVEGSFRSDAAPHAFDLREIGIMAHIGAEADRLYSVANVLAESPDHIDPAAPTIQAFKIKLVIDRIPTAQLVVTIGPSENVLGSNIGADTVGPGWYKDAAGNILNFKRVIVGTGMEIYDTPTADPTAIYIGVSTLHNDLDIYVPTNYPGVIDPKVLFPSVQAAHDYLLGFVIPPDKFARIHVGPNILPTATTITFSHPNSKQISLIGQPRVERTIAQIVGTGPLPLGSTQKEVALVDQSLLAVGRNVYLYGCQPTWVGGCKITALRANVVTLSHFRKDTQTVFAPTDTTANMKLKWYPSCLVNTDPNAFNSLAPCISFPNGIKQIENMCFEGCGYILQITEGLLKNCQIIGGTGGVTGTFAKRCLNQFQGFFGFIGEIVLSNGGWGVFSLGTITAFDQTVCNGNNIGVQASGAGTAIGSITGGMPNTIVYLVHNQYGALAGNGGSFVGGSVFYCENDYGFRAQGLSVVSLGAAYGSFPQHNGIDLSAQGNSYIGYTRWGQPVPSCDPLNDTVGNQNAIIHVLP